LPDRLNSYTAVAMKTGVFYGLSKEAISSFHTERSIRGYTSSLSRWRPRRRRTPE